MYPNAEDIIHSSFIFTKSVFDPHINNLFIYLSVHPFIYLLHLAALWQTLGFAVVVISYSVSPFVSFSDSMNLKITGL